MSGETFGEHYASVYDRLYSDKDYGRECEILNGFLRDSAEGDTHRILDLGCGTGGHAIPLALMGYEVVGVDRSEAMLARARAKASAIEPAHVRQRVLFVQGDIRKIDLGTAFDALLMMFAVLGYQLENDDLDATLSVVSRHLRPGGLFLGDVWFGPAVLHQGPTLGVKTVNGDMQRTIRIAAPELEVLRHRCVVHYHVLELSSEGTYRESQEAHGMRFFFPKELEHHFADHGLRMEALVPFPNVTEPVGVDTWNVLFRARRVP